MNLCYKQRLPDDNRYSVISYFKLTFICFFCQPISGQDNISFEDDSLVPPIINEPNVNQTTLPTQIPQT